MTDVKCKVKSCYYWDNGDVCKADTIMVDNNSLARGNVEAGGRNRGLEVGELNIGAGRRDRDRDFEVGDLGGGAGLQGQERARTTRGESDLMARTSHETLCSTFRPRGSEPRH